MITIIYFAIQILISVTKCILRFLQPKSLENRYGKNSWVVVTGASDGIGKGFCEEFATQNFNLCLIARNKQKLEKVEKELHQLNPSIKTKIIVADFKQSNINTLDYFDNIIDQIKQCGDISVLVNNVGVSQRVPFYDHSEQDILDMINVNCLPAVFLTKKLINQMNSRQQYRSAIINVASMSCLRPLPYFVMYGATKQFLDYFSQSLSIEYHKKIDIHCLKPGYVSSQMTQKRKSFWVKYDTISSRQCANDCLNHIRFERDTLGNIRFKFLELMQSQIPIFLHDMITRNVLLKKKYKYQNQKKNN